MIMKWLLERSRHLVVVAVLCCLVAALFAFAWGAVKTWKVAALVLQDPANEQVPVGFIELMDAFFIAVALLIFAIAVYELFVADVDVPKWLTVTSLHAFKVRLMSVVVLVMAIKFLELFMQGGDSMALMQRGIAVAVVSGALIGFSRLGLVLSGRLCLHQFHSLGGGDRSGA